MYRTEVIVRSLPVSQWLEKYCFPGKYLDACKDCPDYGRAWSCPPGVPSAEEYLGGYRCVYIVGVKVIYDEAERRQAAVSPERAEQVRAASYGKVKKALLDALLGLEAAFPESRTIAAGRCEQCESCTRTQGLPCRKPGRMRYSFSAFGFDLTALAEELLGIKLLWASQGLPDYNAAIAAFLTR